MDGILRIEVLVQGDKNQAQSKRHTRRGNEICASLEFIAVEAVSRYGDIAQERIERLELVPDPCPGAVVKFLQ